MSGKCIIKKSGWFPYIVFYVFSLNAGTDTIPTECINV